jgi:hypothetical protein
VTNAATAAQKPNRLVMIRPRAKFGVGYRDARGGALMCVNVTGE